MVKCLDRWRDRELRVLKKGWMGFEEWMRGHVGGGGMP